MKTHLTVEGLDEFVGDLSNVPNVLEEQRAAGFEAVGDILKPVAQEFAPNVTGYLAGSAGIEMTEDALELLFPPIYAGVLENATRGRWSGLSGSYGPPPRFAGRALEETAEETREAFDSEIEEVLTVNGWFRED